MRGKVCMWYYDTRGFTLLIFFCKARLTFHAKTLAYCNKLNEVEVKRKYELVENVSTSIQKSLLFGRFSALTKI